jgi:hypothetical protein
MLVGFNPKGSEAPPAPVMSSCVPPTVPSVTHKPERPLGPGLEKERCLGVALAHVVLALVVIVMDHVHCAWVTSPAGGFFSSQFLQTRADCCPATNSAVFLQIQPDSSKSGLFTRIQVYSSNVELDLTHF